MPITDATNDSGTSMNEETVSESKYEALSQEEQDGLLSKVSKRKRKAKEPIFSTNESETEITEVPTLDDELPEIDFVPHGAPVKEHAHTKEMNDRMHSEYVPPLEEEKFSATSFNNPTSPNNPSNPNNPNGLNWSDFADKDGNTTIPGTEPNKGSSSQPKPNNIDPDFNGAMKKEARKRATNLWNFIKDIYLMFVFAAREKIKIPQSKIRSLINDYGLTLNMAIPDDESPTGWSDITFEEWVNSFNTNAPKILDNEEDFCNKLEEDGIIDYFISKGWGLSEDKNILYAIGAHFLQISVQFYFLIKNKNFVINKCKEKRTEEIENGEQPTNVSEDRNNVSETTNENNNVSNESKPSPNAPKQSFNNMDVEEIQGVEIMR